MVNSFTSELHLGCAFFLPVNLVYVFPCAGSNWSAIGTMAKFIDSSEPTMVFDFSAFDSYTIKHAIVHQFGHALGLGHALMSLKDWSTLKKYVDVKEMMRSYGVESEEHFEVEWTGKDLSGVNHDTNSVMQYTYVYVSKP